ncbi:hypothetical protein [Micromonospora aurantiaca (nom. illeg.)]|uniref:hypothetical protein n=1 Tax=Micromonospora aurantiaca (nom. illeg.) TaxID=47850 RepID=UPI0033D48FA3
MVQVGKLPQGQRLVLAELSGLADRYGTGTQRDVDRGRAVAELRAVTTDPVLLGITAGTKMADPTGVSGPAVELLRAAGADMQVAAEQAAEVRARLEAQGIRYREG